MQYLFVLLSFFSIQKHDFHVSITYAELKDNDLQITMKVFTDDLEAALEEAYDREPNLGEPDENEGIDKMLYDYLARHFKLKREGAELNYTFVGTETEQDITFIYFEVADVGELKQLKVRHTLFFDRFTDQSNIVNVKLGDQLKTAFLKESEPEKTLRFD